MTVDKRAFVLLVEDNPADADLVEVALAEAKVECGLHVLDNGTKALEFIARLEKSEAPCPDLIVLDLNIPQLSGEEVLKRIRSNPICGAVKVLIVTSSNAESDRLRAMELGATDYFRKPSNLEQFLKLGPKVRQLLEY